MCQDKLPVVILISGRGSNMQAIIDAWQLNSLDIEIRAVISNRPDAAGLMLAEKAGLKTIVINHQDYGSREAFDLELMKEIDEHEPELVILAGFMRILNDNFVNHYLGRMLNIHPSLLPKYPGLNTHQRALNGKDDIHGASIHFVTTELDGGPVVIQVKVPVKPDDNANSLAARVLIQEHKIYCLAIQWYAEKRLQLDNNKIILDGKVLTQPYLYEVG